MMFSDKDKIKKFLELVNKGAQLKAFNRSLGLDRAGIAEHLGYIVQYEHILSEPEPEKESVKIVESLSSTIQSVTLEPVEDPQVLDDCCDDDEEEECCDEEDTDCCDEEEVDEDTEGL